MPRKRHTSAEQNTDARKPTPTFLLELPLQVTPGQAKRLRAHLEAARQLYNAILSEGQRRLRHMRADPGGPEARSIPRTHKQERASAFSVEEPRNRTKSVVLTKHGPARSEELFKVHLGRDRV